MSSMQLVNYTLIWISVLPPAASFASKALLINQVLGGAKLLDTLKPLVKD